MTYKVFVRTWWREARTQGWPNNLEPCPGDKTYIGETADEEEAREMCRQFNTRNPPGRYSRKAEYEADK